MLSLPAALRFRRPVVRPILAVLACSLGGGGVNAQEPANDQAAPSPAADQTSPAAGEASTPAVAELLARLDRLAEELAATHAELQRRGVERPDAAAGATGQDALQQLRLLRADHAAQAARLRAAETAASQARRAHEQVSAQVVDLRRSLVAAEKELSTLRDGNRTSVPAGADDRLQALSQDLAQTRQALEAAVAAAQAEQAQETERRQAAERAQAEAEARADGLQRQLAEAQHVIEPLEREKRRLEQALAEARRSAATVTAPAPEPAPRPITPDGATRQAELREAAAQADALRAALAEREHRVLEEQARVANLEAENERLLQRQQQLEDEVARLAGQLVAVRQEPAAPPIPTIRIGTSDGSTRQVQHSDSEPPGAVAPAPVRAPLAAAPTDFANPPVTMNPEPAAPMARLLPGASPARLGPDGRPRFSPTRPGTAAAVRVAGATPLTTTPVSPPAPAPAPAVRYHEVGFGDSLTRISVRYYGTARRWEDIFEANRDVLSDPNQVQVGQRLRIPGVR